MTVSSRLSAGLLLAALVGTWVTVGRSAPRPPAEPVGPPLTVSAPVAHDNLAVYVVRGPDEFDAGNVMTLQEALDRGLAVVHETGNVNMLAVENRSDDQELFLQSGDIVKGGRQDRLIASDMVLPPKSGKVDCPANCCEQSRWTGRGTEAASYFAKSTDFAVGNDIRIANATRAQGEVWANVDKAQKQLSEKVGKTVNAAASPTSLQLALEDKDLAAKLAAYERALARAADYPDAVGVVVAVNGKVVGADVYGSAKLFKKVWPKLLKAAAADALAQMPKDVPVPAAPRVWEAEKFLASAAGAAERQADRGNAGLELRDEVTAAVGIEEINADVLTTARDVGLHQNAAPAVTSTATARPESLARGASTHPAPETLNNLTPAQYAVSQQEATNLGFGGGGFGGFGGGNAQATPASAGVALNANPVGGRGNPVRQRIRPANPAAAPTPPGIVVVESRVPSAPGVTVHRGYLKK